MSRIKCCMDCKERCVGCHSKCERYLKEKAISDKVLAEKIKTYGIDQYYKDMFK